MKNKEQFKVILKAIKKGSIPFKSYSNGIFQLDDIGLEAYFIDAYDSVESIKKQIKSYQSDFKKYQNFVHRNSHKLVWNWMNI